ncbi:YbjP/YqhG family protein [Acetobacter sp. TBRC 12305]|uniref:DUF3828 domain-containing protein n=1 Tax=Acetobacter garciniae TaxID=2817435 RepID=A0A939HPE7_9PROT|nr:DUF3828 domain-containing protein [Acetobacter garciniae]MBO1324826.1 DUF3828 domain-containing protein [Acetobacter garciniae]MBX0344517.1 YbjP/YqhG family protein [Acetobacter garciniae]
MKKQPIKFTNIHNRLKMLGVCIFVFFPLWVRAQRITPEQKVLEFYQNYMTACAQPFPGKSKVNLDGLFCNMDIKNYVTKTLYKKIIHAYKSGIYGDLTGDRDYFTHTQDFDVQWIAGMKAMETEKSGNNSVIRLLMNFPKGTGEPLAVCIRLQRDGNDWKIYQVDPSLYNDLPDCKDK